jgi:LytS/YehU family sensor histidine kinase
MIAAEATVLPRLRHAPDALHNPRRLGAWSTGIVYGSAALIGSYLAIGITQLFVLPGFLGGARDLLVSGMFALLFTLLFGGFSYAAAFYRVAVERAGAAELARAELAQAELRALRAQIHPHFLFNTLNTIAALIAEQPRAAEDTTTRLAEAFRYVLRASEHEHQRLGDELGFVRAYLEIERARFGPRLRLTESIAPGLDDLPVPTLLLQPLVENAVRHAVASRERGATIGLKARREGDRLVLEVSDDGPGMNRAPPSSGAGFGLHSVGERLRAAGPPHALEIDSAPGGGTTVRVTLPCRA